MSTGIMREAKGDSNDERLDEMERDLWRHIRSIQEQYSKAVEPYFKRLNDIHNVRAPRPIIIEKQHTKINT
jgi:hypothetical protein